MSALAACLPEIAVKHRFTAFTVALVALLVFAAFATGLQAHDRIITRTQTVKLTVQQQYGAPAQTIDGAQINQALTGFTCDVYRDGPTVICHR
jgi:hypothetical protein